MPDIHRTKEAAADLLVASLQKADGKEFKILKRAFMELELLSYSEIVELKNSIKWEQ